MATTLYSVAISVDGFNTGPDGDMSWLTPYLGPNPVTDELIQSVGSMLIGRRTFGGDDPGPGPGPVSDGDGRRERGMVVKQVCDVT